MTKHDPYSAVIAFLLDECGACFTDVPSNVNALAAHLGIDRRQAHAVLGTMTRKGALRWSRRDRTWTVVNVDERAA